MTTVTAPKGGGAHNELSTGRNESTSSLYVPNGRIHRPRIIYSALVVEADDGRTAAADARRNSLGVRARR